MNNVSPTMDCAWVASTTFLNCHRPPIDESRAEQASSTPGQLLELTEAREGDTGDIGISHHP